MPLRTGRGIALLADPTRRRIIAALATKPRRPSRLASDLAVSRPAVARQLRLLEEAELIVAHEVAGDGRGILYTINPRRHGAITAWLAGTEVGRESAQGDRPVREA
ncbi:MAG TPA: winged helix-turn-helix domain-containing protein [Candidatus Limnocylindrales bacterium]|nr:winged helix-turn-helix domain-containing protein [Candidatus Limnocylindrales bacterium]